MAFLSSRREVTHDTVQLPSGTLLEYTLFNPDTLSNETGEDNKLAVCLHPWSWLGGRMDDPVLSLLSGPLEEKGYHILRSNSRGVGKSTGWPSLSGSREVQDLQELVQWAVSCISSVSSVLVIGYSYGSLIASRMPVLPNVKTSHLLLSYPLGPRHWLTAFHGKTYTTALGNLVRDPNSNVLVVYGDQDNFTSSDMYTAWLEQLKAGAEPYQGSLQIARIPQGSHFWREEDAQTELVKVVLDWLP